jgi:rubrerythrin
MANISGREYQALLPELACTLWRCERCNSLVSIYAAQFIGSAVCPICPSESLLYCGDFEKILGTYPAD